MIGEKIGVSFHQFSVLTDNCKTREDFPAAATSTVSVHILHQQ